MKKKILIAMAIVAVIGIAFLGFVMISDYIGHRSFRKFADYENRIEKLCIERVEQMYTEIMSDENRRTGEANATWVDEKYLPEEWYKELRSWDRGYDLSGQEITDYLRFDKWTGIDLLGVTKTTQYRTAESRQIKKIKSHIDYSNFERKEGAPTYIDVYFITLVRYFPSTAPSQFKEVEVYHQITFECPYFGDSIKIVKIAGMYQPSSVAGLNATFYYIRWEYKYGTRTKIETIRPQNDLPDTNDIRYMINHYLK